MRTWQLPVNKKRQQATHAPSETDENLRHVVSPASRPGVFQIALFKGFPDIPHIPLPPEHSVGRNEATRSPTRENPESWQERRRPREIYKCRKWVVKGKQPFRHHDIWEDIYQSLQSKIALVSMTHVYGHNKLVHNDAADELARAGAAKSTVHKTSRPRGPTDDGPRVRRQKHTRTRGVKRQAAMQVSDSDSGSDRPIVICHRRREMRNAPLDIPDPEPD